MKKTICKLLTLLSMALIINTANASNCSTPDRNNKNFNFKFAYAIVQQQHPRDTTSYWVIADGYYITFTKDTASAGQWVYKSYVLATNVKNQDPAKKIAGATATSTGMALKITIGNKIYLFRNMKLANILRYITTEPNNTSSPDNSSVNK
jgi:hypothetical protein